jgi:hypothetical protein
VAEALELGDESFGDAFGMALAEVVVSEVVVQLAGGEHVPDHAEDRVLDRTERLPGIVHSSSTTCAKGRISSSIRSDSASICSSRKSEQQSGAPGRPTRQTEAGLTNTKGQIGVAGDPGITVKIFTRPRPPPTRG